MKASKVYREAALLMERGLDRDIARGSCAAISDVLYPNDDRWGAYEKTSRRSVLKEYERLFAPSNATGSYWGAGWREPGSSNAQNDCRILALCFMAAIAASEGR